MKYVFIEQLAKDLSDIAAYLRSERDSGSLDTGEEALLKALEPFLEPEAKAFTVTYTITTTVTYTQEVEAATEQDAKDSVLNEEFLCHDEGEEQDSDVDVDVVDVEEQG